LLPTAGTLAGWILCCLMVGLVKGKGAAVKSPVRAGQRGDSGLPYWLVRPRGMATGREMRFAGMTAALICIVTLFLVPSAKQAVAESYLYAAERDERNRLGLLRRGYQCDSQLAALKLGLAETLSNSGNYAEALPLFEAEHGAKVLAAKAHNGLGLLFYRRGQLTVAYWQIYRALQIDPGLADAYLNMGDIYSSRGGFARAVGFYRLGLERMPNDARLHYALAESLYNTKRLEAAIASYRRAGELDSKNAEVNYKIGLCYFYLGKGEEAALSLKKYLRQVPKNRRARDLLGRCDY